MHADPKALLALLRALPDHPIIQINHPRFRYQSLFDTTHWDGKAWPPPFPLGFDAVEVLVLNQRQGSFNVCDVKALAMLPTCAPRPNIDAVLVEVAEKIGAIGVALADKGHIVDPRRRPL